MGNLLGNTKGHRSGSAALKFERQDEKLMKLESTEFKAPANNDPKR